MTKNKAAVRISGVLLTICLALGGAVAMVGTGVASPTGKVESAYASTRVSVNAFKTAKKKADRAALSIAQKRFKQSSPSRPSFSETSNGIKVRVNTYSVTGTYKFRVNGGNYKSTKTIKANSYIYKVYNKKGKLVKTKKTGSPVTTFTAKELGLKQKSKITGYTVKVQACFGPAEAIYSKWNSKKVSSGVFE